MTKHTRMKMGFMAAALVAAAACGDNGVGPSESQSGVVSPKLISTTYGKKGDTTITQFTIDPTTSSTFAIGSATTLYVPANSVCDPAASSYGIGTWNSSCPVLGRNLVITAKTWSRADGSPAVDFSPSLRFAPTSSGDVPTITLRFATKLDAKQAAAANALRIDYCATPTTPCIDESLTDRSLATRLNVSNASVYRRIKHFSGYNVSSGRSGGTDASDGL